MASDFAVSEVFQSKKYHTGKPSHAVALQSTNQLQDHDDAYGEGMNNVCLIKLEIILNSK